jgi:hypothetical protein
VHRRVGDRRIRQRFEIVGELRGIVDVPLALLLKNVSSRGCLIESPLPLVLNSMHVVTLKCDGREMPIRMLVRHVHSATPADPWQTYLIGLEFLALTPAMTDQIAVWTADPGGAAET